MELGNRKSGSENSELMRQLDDVDSNISMLHKIRHQLNNELEQVKKMYDEESKEMQSTLGRFRNLKHEFDGLAAVYEEEVTAKENFHRQCQKAEEETNLWRLKYEKDGIAKIEELENTKMKLQARLAECEGTVENLNTKLVQLEKSKSQLQENIEDITAKVDQTNIINIRWKRS